MKIKSIKSVGKRKVYDISVANVNHYIMENGVASHNTGSYYSADNIFIIGRRQEKKQTELLGYNFIINVEKSRYVREKSKIPISVRFEGGLSTWSGLIEMALECGCVIKPNQGWYQRVDLNTGEAEDKKWRLADTDTKEFWKDILTNKAFQEWIKNKYQISSGDLMAIDVEEENEI